jgi:hypothetical protein
VTSIGLFGRVLLLLVICSACGGKSRVILADTDPTDAGGPTGNDAATDANDASVAEPRDAGEDAPLRSCAAETISAEPPKEGAILAVPTSAVMSATPPGETRTRFDATRDSIVASFDGVSLSPYIGLVLSPDGEENCLRTTTVEAEPVARGDQRKRLVAELEAVTEPAGTASLLWQLRYARSLAVALPSDVHTALVLFMDGAPEDDLGCSATLETLSGELTAVLEAGDQTPYLVATPGSDAGELARTLAERIGCPDCALDFSAERDFAQSLSLILAGNRAASLVCDFPIPVPAGGGQLDIDSVTVSLSLNEGAPEVLPRRTECGEADGYTIEGDQSRIFLCPTTCAQVHASFMPTLTIDACAKP